MYKTLKKAPSEILVKYIYIPDYKINLASFVSSRAKRGAKRLAKRVYNNLLARKNEYCA